MSVDLSTTAPLPPLPEDSTSRLMRMLESVRLEKAETGQEATASAVRTVCPQCESPEPWGNSSWCPECGYYPKLGRAMTPSEIESTQERKQTFSLIWLFWLTLGLLCLVGFSIAVRMLFPDEAERGSFGRIQFIFGVILLLAAQVRAYLVATQGRDDLPFSSMFFEPFQVWPSVLRQLPRTRHSCYWGGWGGMALLLALFVTGMDFNGMFSGLKSKKPKKSMMQMIVQTVSALSNKSAPAESSEESEEDAGGADGSHFRAGRCGRRVCCR